jgi:hypothetical protein
VRRYLVGGLGGLLLLAGVTHLFGSSGCSEPTATAYGNPNGLDRNNLPGEPGTAPLMCSVEGRFDGGCPSFATDIYPFFSPSGKFRCSDSGCHGGTNGPPIDGQSATSCLSSLKAITIGGSPYLAEGNTDPSASAISCSLRGGCGSKMPKPPGADPSTDDLCAIEAWLKCGAPP